MTTWTNEEITLLRLMWEKSERNEIQKKIPDKTWLGICHKANRLGLARNSFQEKWLPFEERLLAKHWVHSSRPDLQKILFNRTWHSIKCKANTMELGERHVLPNETIGFLDIETSDLNAPFGIVYTYCIKILGGELISRKIEFQDLYHAKFDKELLRKFCQDVENITRLVVHYGVDRKFDLPFLRSRAVYHRLPFPEYKFCYVNDTHTILRNKFRLRSNRLGSACQFLHISAKKHPINPKIWLNMITGNKKLMERSINYILKHNKEDVLSTEALWNRINPYINKGKSSI